jgi:ATP synthase protein I
MKKNSPLRTVLFVQSAACAILSLLALSLSKVVAFSLLLGMLIFIIPNAYFTHYAFRFQGSKWAPWVRQSFMFGEMGKLSLTSVGFALTFVFVDPLHVGALFVGFTLMIIIQWWLARYIANTLAAKKLD